MELVDTPANARDLLHDAMRFISTQSKRSIVDVDNSVYLDGLFRLTPHSLLYTGYAEGLKLSVIKFSNHSTATSSHDLNVFKSVQPPCADLVLLEYISFHGPLSSHGLSKHAVRMPMYVQSLDRCPRSSCLPLSSCRLSSQ